MQLHRHSEIPGFFSRIWCAALTLVNLALVNLASWRFTCPLMWAINVVVPVTDLPAKLNWSEYQSLPQYGHDRQPKGEHDALEDAKAFGYPARPTT